MNLNGGYAMIKHNATQEELAIAYKTKRPILLYDEDKRAHWAQINEKKVEIVDEETQETITTYEYSYQLLNAIEALVDDSGNPRFIEGDGVPATIDGFTVTYCKWSLSGTHLMLVLACAFANGTTCTNGTKLASFTLPNYIMDKIVPVWATRNIERKVYNLYDDTWASQSNAVVLTKYDTLDIQQGTDFTSTSDKKVRIQFDLLIDTK